MSTFDSKVSKSHTRAIAQFVSGLTYDAIPPPVRERIKLLILDAIGCGIYGAGQPWCTILQSTLGDGDQRRQRHRADMQHGLAVHVVELESLHLGAVEQRRMRRGQFPIAAPDRRGARRVERFERGA